MATKTAGKVDLEALQRQIVSRAQKLREVQAQEDHLRTRLYADTYVWCEGVVSSGAAKSLSQAWASLSASAGSHPQAVERWYYAGAWMRRHKVSPEGKAKAGAVLRARHTDSTVSKADSVKVVDAIKKGGRPGDVIRLIKSAERRSGHEVAKRGRHLEQRGQLTAKHLKLEMMVVAGLLARKYKRPIELAACDQETADVLLSVNAEPPRAEG